MKRPRVETTIEGYVFDLPRGYEHVTEIHVDLYEALDAAECIRDNENLDQPPEVFALYRSTIPSGYPKNNSIS